MARRHHAAVLSADAVGYSRLMQADEARTLRIRNQCIQGISDRVRQYGGRVVDATGDNLLAEFRNSVDAVAAGVEAQRAVITANAILPHAQRLPFRIGIAQGEVLEDDDRIAGDCVNSAARLEGLAAPGGICVASDVAEEVSGKLPLRFRDRGTRPIKNMQPLRLSEVVMPRPGLAMPGAGQLSTWKIRVGLTSRAALIGYLALAVAGCVVIRVAPQEESRSALLGGTLGFSLLFAYVFFRYGIERLPLHQRTIATVMVLSLLMGSMVVQTRAVAEVVPIVVASEMRLVERIIVRERVVLDPPEEAIEARAENSVEPFTAPEDSSQELVRQSTHRLATASPSGYEAADRRVARLSEELPESENSRQKAEAPTEPTQTSESTIVVVTRAPRSWPDAIPCQPWQGELSLALLRPEELIRQIVDEVVAILQDPALDDLQRRGCIEALAYERFHFDTVSRLVLGRDWRRFTEPQRQEFMEEFRILLSRSYGERINRYEQERVEILKVREEPRGDMTVVTRIQGGAADGIEIAYRTRKREERWGVIDVTVEGTSLVSNYKSQFKELLGNGSPDNLLRRLREKNARVLLP